VTDTRNESSPRSWTFLTNHAHVLLAVAKAPDLRLREIADLVGVTERTAMQIVVDLELDGYLRRERRGRRNHYTVAEHLHLRHPLEEHHEISQLLHALEHRPRDETPPVADDPDATSATSTTPTT
jgi:DNA-binding MarR family transcriptional regulator